MASGCNAVAMSVNMKEWKGKKKKKEVPHCDMFKSVKGVQSYL